MPSNLTVIEPALVSICRTGSLRSTLFAVGPALTATASVALAALAAAVVEDDRLQPAKIPAARNAKTQADGQKWLERIRGILLADDIGCGSI